MTTTAAYAPLMDHTEEQVKAYLTPEEALRLTARLRRVKLFLRVDMFLYTQTPDDGVPARGFDLNETLAVSTAQARQVLERKAQFAAIKRDKDGTELRLEVVRLGHCLFLG